VDGDEERSQAFGQDPLGVELGESVRVVKFP